eukprot:4003784-Amphidinium_carterae.1
MKVSGQNGVTIQFDPKIPCDMPFPRGEVKISCLSGQLCCFCSLCWVLVTGLLQASTVGIVAYTHVIAFSLPQHVGRRVLLGMGTSASVKPRRDNNADASPTKNGTASLGVDMAAEVHVMLPTVAKLTHTRAQTCAAAAQSEIAAIIAEQATLTGSLWETLSEELSLQEAMWVSSAAEGRATHACALLSEAFATHDASQVLEALAHGEALGLAH